MSRVSTAFNCWSIVGESAFYKIRPAIIALETVSISGHHGIGKGFHLGNGVVVTARHVVEGRQSVRLHASIAEGGRIEDTIFAAKPLADVALLPD